MKLGIRSYTYTWAIGLPGQLPADPMNYERLIEKALELEVGLIQVADNLPLDWMNEAQLVDYDLRLLKESGKAYELGTAGPRRNILAKLPEGKWDIFLYDMIAKSSRELGTNVSGEFTFNLPESQA